MEIDEKTEMIREFYKKIANLYHREEITQLHKKSIIPVKELRNPNFVKCPLFTWMYYSDREYNQGTDYWNRIWNS